MYDKELDFNFLSIDNNARISSSSSQTKGCPSTNLLSTDKKAIWLSETSIPQYITIDLTQLIKKPKSYFKFFGVYCWHAYSTNPKQIEIQFSKDNKNFLSFGKYDLVLKPGTQFFEIRNSKLLEHQKFRYFKIIIRETYGGNRTYINQIYLFEDLSNAPQMNSSTNESCKFTEKVRSKSESFYNVDSMEESIQERKLKYMETNESNIEQEEKPEKAKKPTKREIINRNLIEEVVNRSEQEEKENKIHSKYKQITREKKSQSNEFKSYKLKSAETNNEYRVLENQLKDMEECLKSLKSIEADDICYQDDYRYTSSTSSKLLNQITGNPIKALTHSKSFSFLNPHRDTSELFNYKLNNPFTEHNNDNNNICNRPSNDHLSGLDKYLPKYNLSNDLPKQSPPSQDLRIKNLEEKVTIFEGEINDMKNSLQKLIEAVNKLIEKESSNEMINFILNECNKMINEKIDHKFSPLKNKKDSCQFSDYQSERKKNRNYEDFEESKTMIKKFLIKRTSTENRG
jgi:hypothetical protein